MSAQQIAVDVLVAAALLVTVTSVFGAVVLRTTFGKLHYLTPVTSVAAPLFGAALVIDNWWGITAGLDMVIVALITLSGPVLEAAVARVEAQRAGVLVGEGPQ